MRVLLGFAALAALMPLWPAQSQSFTSSAFGSPSAGSWVSTPSQPGRRHDRMRVNVHRGFARAYGYAGYGYETDFDGNRSFDPDKWNDWWHDRPDRAYPHWMRTNADCARRWYAGDVLTC